MSKRLAAQKKKTPQENMNEAAERDKALRELERLLGKPSVKRWSLEEYQAMIESERKEKRGGWYEGDSQS